MNYLRKLFHKFLYFARRFQQVFSFFERDKLFPYIADLGMRLKIGESWNHDNSTQNFSRRRYKSYNDYLVHQATKLKLIDLPAYEVDLSSYDVKYRQVLVERLSKVNILKPGNTVLCLAARIGTEVKSFLDAGCFAVGIDLNPGQNNRYVVYGDFHEIQFAPDSVDVVFTNSLDHVFNIGQLISEIRRVLKPGGMLILEAVQGEGEGRLPGFYESFWWSKIEDLISLFESSGFELMARSPFDFPWNGEQLWFKIQKRSKLDD